MGPKDQASIPSGPPHRAHNNTTTMQCQTKTHELHQKMSGCFFRDTLHIIFDKDTLSGHAKNIPSLTVRNCHDKEKDAAAKSRR